MSVRKFSGVTHARRPTLLRLCPTSKRLSHYRKEMMPIDTTTRQWEWDIVEKFDLDPGEHQEITIEIKDGTS